MMVLLIELQVQAAAVLLPVDEEDLLLEGNVGLEPPEAAALHPR